MGKTKIDCCDEVWNPVTGCSKISEGCQNCYAEKMANRLQKMGLYKYRNGFKVECHDDEFEKHFPGKGKRIFVNSMSDLFHPEVPFDFVDSVFTEISKHNNRHVFIILTKRPERMKEYLMSDRSNHKFAGYMDWPLKNLWLGVSVENQQAADKRIPLLLQTPAALRFVSVEPMLEAVDLNNIKISRWNAIETMSWGSIDWVICGCESGAKRRPFNPDWARSLRDQCTSAGIPFFLKQIPFNILTGISKMPLFDGKRWNQIPEVEM